MIRNLFKKLSVMKELVGDVIAEIKFSRGNFSEGVEVLKSYRSMKLICAANSNEKLLVKFITPSREIKAAIGTRIQSDKKTWRIFTSAEVTNFVNEVGDSNEIHRFNPPIVPGFLIFEEILNHENFSSCNVLNLKFKHFITAGEPLTLIFAEDKSEILSAGEVKVVIRKIVGDEKIAIIRE